MCEDTYKTKYNPFRNRLQKINFLIKSNDYFFVWFFSFLEIVVPFSHKRYNGLLVNHLEEKRTNKVMLSKNEHRDNKNKRKKKGFMTSKRSALIIFFFFLKRKSTNFTSTSPQISTLFVLSVLSANKSVCKNHIWFGLHVLTSLNGNKRNSSVPTTCWKFCKAYLCDLVWSSLHEWASVNRNKLNWILL